jgi:hypothetical protein
MKLWMLMTGFVQLRPNSKLLLSLMRTRFFMPLIILLDLLDLGGKLLLLLPLLIMSLLGKSLPPSSASTTSLML